MAHVSRAWEGYKLESDRRLSSTQSRSRPALHPFYCRCEFTQMLRLAFPGSHFALWGIVKSSCKHDASPSSPCSGLDVNLYLN